MKALPTTYSGYKFRSRVEARWAVFFDALGLDWEFEPEGFDTGVGLYLPDFRVTYPGRDKSERHDVWFEVKGNLNTVTDAEWLKMLAFEHNVEHFIILDGSPDRRMYCSPSELLEASGRSLGDVSKVIMPPRLHWSAVSPTRGGWALHCHKERLWWDEHVNFWGSAEYPSELHEYSGLEYAIHRARSKRFGRIH